MFLEYNEILIGYFTGKSVFKMCYEITFYTAVGTRD